MTDFTSTEYEQICESYNDHRRIFIQIVVLLAIADVSLIGYAVAEQAYSVFLFCGLIMWILFRAQVRIADMTLVVVLRGLKLERTMGVTGLMHYIAAGVRGKPSFLDQITESGLFDCREGELEIVAGLQQKLKNLSVRYDVPFALSKLMARAIIALTIVQTILGVWGLIASLS